MEVRVLTTYQLRSSVESLTNICSIRLQEEVNSTDLNNFSPIRLSIYEDSSNDIKGEGNTQKKNEEKGHSVSDSTVVELRGREEAYSTHHGSFSSVWLSDSEKVTKALMDEPNTH
nr:DEP domain-containing protein [Tanacetum cinerariifolium]